MILIHASCVEIDGIGALLRGPPGAGKSDLALRLIDEGARLVADDQVSVTRDGDDLVASPPQGLAGLLEVRGLGILRVDHLTSCPLGVVADLVAAEEIERLPEPAYAEISGCSLPLARIAPFEASAAAKLRQACAALSERAGNADQMVVP